LQRNATGLGSLQRAKKLGLDGDFMGGEKELATTLQIFPDNVEASNLLTEYKRREPEQIARLRVERLNRPKKVFDMLSTRTKDAELFESHQLTTTKPVQEVVSAIVTALQQVPPPFSIMVNNSPELDNYVISAKQTDTGILSASGYRICLIVCGQARDNETQIFFKLMEYKVKHNVSMPGLLAFRDDIEDVPIHPSRIPDMTDKLRAQVQAGVSNLTARIQGAIGQTPAVVQPVLPP
jgi:hypothetical protein